MLSRIALHFRQRLQEGKEVAHILPRHPCIGRIGECGIVVRALRRNAVQHRIGEIHVAPPANAVLRMRRDVGCDEGSEIGLQFHPARKFQPRIAVGPRAGMARGTAAGPENLFATRRVRRFKRAKRPGLQRGRGAQHPERYSTARDGHESGGQQCLLHDSSKCPVPGQLFCTRKFSWQLLQFPKTGPIAAWKAARSAGPSLPEASTAAAVSAMYLSSVA